MSTHVPGVITGGHAVFHASAATAPAGGLDSGVPVPERTRLSRDTAGDIVRATLDVYPADRFVVTYDLDPPGI